MKAQKPTRLLHPVDEARDLLGGIGRTHFYSLVKSGRLNVVKIGKRTFVSDAELHRIAEGKAA